MILSVKFVLRGTSGSAFQNETKKKKKKKKKKIKKQNLAYLLWLR